MNLNDTEPVFSISVVARIVGLHAQTIRTYERMGLVEPHRSAGNIRLYSGRDVKRLMQIRGWIEDLGLNLAGVEVMTRMSDRIAELETECRELRNEVARLRGVTGQRAGRSPNGQ